MRGLRGKVGIVAGGGRGIGAGGSATDHGGGERQPEQLSPAWLVMGVGQGVGHGRSDPGASRDHAVAILPNKFNGPPA